LAEPVVFVCEHFADHVHRDIEFVWGLAVLARVELLGALSAALAERHEAGVRLVIG
jgi:hypothetical protein